MMRVMICDDEPMTVEPLVDRLEYEKVDVFVTDRPQDCLAEAKKQHFDLFILDMNLGTNVPDHLSNGLDLAQALWKLDSALNVPIVGITGYQPEWKERAMELGLVKFITKPFEPGDFVPDLIKLIQSRSVAKQAMEAWLTESYGLHWNVLDLAVSEDGRANIRSNLVAGEGQLREKDKNIELALQNLRQGSMDKEFFEDFGRRLHEVLFLPQIDVGFRQLRFLSRLATRRFRLLLQLKGESWQSLPWEYCRYVGGTDNGHWLGGDPHLTCARVPSNIGHLLDDERLELPLKILVVGASPPDLDPVSLKDELRELESALAPIADNIEWRRLGPEELRPHGVASSSSVDREIRSFGPHIVHVMCHGWKDRLLLEKEWLDYFLGRQLVGTDLKLLFLNSCFSGHPGARSPGLAMEGVTSGVKAIIGHFFPVHDKAAIRFTKLFYEAFVQGDPLDVAFQESRRRLADEELQKGRPFLPILYIRNRFLKLDRGQNVE